MPAHRTVTTEVVALLMTIDGHQQFCAEAIRTRFWHHGIGRPAAETPKRIKSEGHLPSGTLEFGPNIVGAIIRWCRSTNTGVACHHAPPWLTSSTACVALR